MVRIFSKSGIIFLSILLPPTLSFAATTNQNLTVGTATGKSGETVTIPVIFSSNTSAANVWKISNCQERRRLNT